MFYSLIHGPLHPGVLHKDVGLGVWRLGRPADSVAPLDRLRALLAGKYKHLWSQPSARPFYRAHTSAPTNVVVPDTGARLLRIR